MEGLSNFFTKLKERYGMLTKNQKIALYVFIAMIVVGIGAMIYSAVNVQYEVLFSEMTTDDAANVVTELEEQGVDYKVEGDTILVKQNDTDELRMRVLSNVDITGGSIGWELFDQNSSVNSDFENNITHQRALAGEIERMIKTFDEVQDAKVLLNIPESSVFERSQMPASASVVISLNQGVTRLTDGQVRAIVAIIAGSVDNLAYEDVNIVVDGIELVTSDLFTEDGGPTFSVDEQNKVRQEREKELEDKVIEQLSKVYGPNGLSVAVSLDMSFDAKTVEDKTYGDSHVISEQVTGNSTTTAGGGSPVDNNMGTTVDGAGNVVESTDETRNYVIDERNERYVEAPGNINKMTVSILVDESVVPLTSATERDLVNLAGTAVGYDANREDSISVASMNFINNSQSAIDDAILDMQQAAIADKKQDAIKSITLAIGAIAILSAILVYLNREEEEYETRLDVVVDDTNNEGDFEPIEFEVKTKEAHVQEEVKNYASDKPEQVADIVKAWLSEDER